MVAVHALNLEGFFHGGFPFNGLGQGDTGCGRMAGQVCLRLAGDRNGGCRCRSEKTQAQRVGDDGYRAETHGRRGDHRVQHQPVQTVKHSGGDRDTDDIVNEGPEQVLANRSHDGPAQPDGGDDIGQIVFHQDDIGRFDGDIGTGADRHADTGAGQCRGVVDAVADHDGFFPAFLKRTDFPFLVLRQHFGQYPADAGLSLYGCGGPGVVAGQHDDIQPHRFESGDGLPAGRLDTVGNGDHAEQGVFADEIEDGFSVIGQRSGHLADIVNGSGL